MKGHAFDRAKEQYPDFNVEDITVLRVTEEYIYQAYQDMLHNS